MNTETKKMTASGRAKGQALVMAMIFLVTLTFLGFGLMTMATIDTSSAKSLRLSEQVLNAAEEGVLLGMAYSSDPTTNFIELSEGESVTVAGSTVTTKRLPPFPATSNTTIANRPKDKLQYLVTVIMRGPTPSPPGFALGSGAPVFFMVEIRSTGYINEVPFAQRNVAYDWTKAPAIRRNLQVLARVMIPAGP